MHRPAIHATLATALLILLATGCPPPGGDEGRIQGRVDQGAAGREVSEAVTVRAWLSTDQAGMELLAETGLEPDGTYALDLDPGLDRLVIDAVDEEEEVVAAALLASTGDEGDRVTVAPMEVETWAETRVYLAMLARGMEPSAIDPVDVQARVDWALAGALDALAATRDADPELAALALATAAAQATEVDAYGNLGLQISQDDLFRQEREASATLAEILDAGTEDRDAAQEVFFTDLADAALELGADPWIQSQVDAQASMAWRTVLHERLDTPEQAPLLASCALTMAALEARTSTRAAEAILLENEATEGVLHRASLAGNTLVQDLEDDTTTAEARASWDAWSTELVGGDVQASIVGEFLELDATGAEVVGGLVETAALAATELDLQVTQGVSVALSGEDADPADVSAEVTTAWLDYTGTTWDESTAVLGDYGSLAGGATQIVILATGSFRASR